MFNRKVNAEPLSDAAEQLFGAGAERSWSARTAPGEAAATSDKTSDGEETPSPELPPLERKSYRILRARFLHLPSLKVINRQGQQRVFPGS
jgi:hypothetical protein